MCELLMVRKLVLGEKFPRKLFCVKKTSLGVGLIDPTAAIDMILMTFWVRKKIKWRIE